MLGAASKFLTGGVVNDFVRPPVASGGSAVRAFIGGLKPRGRDPNIAAALVGRQGRRVTVLPPPRNCGRRPTGAKSRPGCVTVDPPIVASPSPPGRTSG